MKILVLTVITFARTDSSRDVLNAFSYTFGLKLFECGEQFNYTRPMAKDILNFWNEEHPLMVEGTGCLIICAMRNLELISPQGELIRTNAEEYVRSNGADDELASYLVELYYRCQAPTSSTTNPCLAALELSKCFRSDIHQLGWTPDITSLLDIPYE